MRFPQDGIQILGDYEKILACAMVDRDPKGLQHAGGLFDRVRRFNDTGYDWLTRRDELEKLLHQLYLVGATIYVSIQETGMDAARNALN